MMPEFRLVEVLWDDAHSMASQQPISALEEAGEEQLVCTVGYLVLESEKSVWVAAECLDGGEVRGTTRIPRGMVREMRELARKKKRAREKPPEPPGHVPA